jgi:hypothetical protein
MTVSARSGSRRAAVYQCRFMGYELWCTRSLEARGVEGFRLQEASMSAIQADLVSAHAKARMLAKIISGPGGCLGVIQ